MDGDMSGLERLLAELVAGGAKSGTGQRDENQEVAIAAGQDPQGEQKQAGQRPGAPNHTQLCRSSHPCQPPEDERDYSHLLRV
jgi:hypothetical protein